jgi:hypothetical protein
MPFFRLIVLLSMFGSHLFGARVRVSPLSVWSTGVDAHVILVGDACPKGDALDGSPILGVLELLNTM